MRPSRHVIPDRATSRGRRSCGGVVASYSQVRARQRRVFARGFSCRRVTSVNTIEGVRGGPLTAADVHGRSLSAAAPQNVNHSRSFVCVRNAAACQRSQRLWGSVRSGVHARGKGLVRTLEAASGATCKPCPSFTARSALQYTRSSGGRSANSTNKK